MWDVGCGMGDVGWAMGDVGWAMGDVGWAMWERGDWERGDKERAVALGTRNLEHQTSNNIQPNSLKS
jgi:hypothetical protein